MSTDLFRKKLIEKINANKGKIVIIADKDGVLCPPHGKIEPIAEILDIVKAGAIFVIISGASIDRAQQETINPLLAAVGNNTDILKNIYLILNNGAGIYQFRKGIYECIFRKDIDKATTKKALDILAETVEKFPEIKDIKQKYPEIQQINDEEIQIVLRILGKMKDDELRKTFDPDAKKRKVWASFIKKRFKEENINLDVSVDGTSSINILLPGVNKGTGIDNLARILKVNNSSLLYLGDNYHEHRNDRIAVDNRIDLAVNFGKEIDKAIPNTTLIDSEKKGVLGAKIYLNMIHEVLEKYNRRD